MSDDETFTGMYELLDAIEAVIKASDPAKREALASTLDAFAEDCPEDFFWAIGATASVKIPRISVDAGGS